MHVVNMVEIQVKMLTARDQNMVTNELGVIRLYN